LKKFNDFGYISHHKKLNYITSIFINKNIVDICHNCIECKYRYNDYCNIIKNKEIIINFNKFLREDKLKRICKWVIY